MKEERRWKKEGRYGTRQREKVLGKRRRRKTERVEKGVDREVGHGRWR